MEKRGVTDDENTTPIKQAGDCGGKCSQACGDDTLSRMCEEAAAQLQQSRETEELKSPK